MKAINVFIIQLFVILLLGIGFFWYIGTHPPPKENPLWGTTTYNGTVSNITYDSTTSTSGSFLMGTSSTTKSYTNIELTDGTVFRVDDAINGLHKGECYTFWLRYDHLVQYKECQ